MAEGGRDPVEEIVELMKKVDATIYKDLGKDFVERVVAADMTLGVSRESALAGLRLLYEADIKRAARREEQEEALGEVKRCSGCGDRGERR